MILVVEDNPVSRQLMMVVLDGAGYEVVAACHGQEALDKLAVHGDNVDAVLMDLQMPVMDGFAAAQEIRTHSEYAKLPLIAMSGDHGVVKQANFIACQFDAFLQKPLTQADIIEVVQRVLLTAA